MSGHPFTLPRPVVLLVEDTDDDAFFFERTLRQVGHPHPVSRAVNGAEAIAWLTKARAGETPLPELIFLDLKMPVCSGFEVLEWIREQKFLPLLNVAVLSGSEHLADVERARGLGASAYYVKPVRAEELRQRLASLARPIVETAPLGASRGEPPVTAANPEPGLSRDAAAMAGNARRSHE